MPNFKPFCQGYRKVTLSKMAYFTLDKNVAIYQLCKYPWFVLYSPFCVFLFDRYHLCVSAWANFSVMKDWPLRLVPPSWNRGGENFNSQPRFQGLPSSLLRSAPRKGRVETLETRLFNSRKKTGNLSDVIRLIWARKIEVLWSHVRVMSPLWPVVSLVTAWEIDFV